MTPPLQFTEVTLSEAERAAFLSRVRPGVSAEDYRLIEGMSHALPELLDLIAQDATLTLRKLRHLLFGPKTEKTDQVCPPAAPPAPVPPAPKPKRPGHGRTKAKDYTGARWLSVPHPHLKAGDRCPQCAQGTLRAQKTPAILLRIVGSPPIAATGYQLERLRCDTCSVVLTAPAPPEAGTQKYDPSVGATVALLRYGTGMPHYRLARLQQSLGVPLPESTQWEVMQPLAQQAQPILEELITLAAQSPLIHHDDTTMRILDLRRPGSATAAQMDPERKGTFTTNLLAYVEAHPVALYFTGWQHAGENLAEVLRQRTAEHGPPIQMCDALSRNLCPELETLVAHCLSHGRREFVSLADKFPAECRHVLEALGEVYRVDAQAKEQGLSAEQRLAHHQTHSQPVLEQLQAWMRRQLNDKLVEPNSGLGEALAYMLRHWEPLTLFLRQAGAPLDNNIAERALKMAILHRKNSLSYKTANGARTGDLFMSLIHTCRLNGVNPFDYLLAIATHAETVKLVPQAWLPWNYPKAGALPGTPGTLASDALPSQ
ncbi:MAG: IS66 family transposase [Methyloceanibacter sp.]